MDTPEWQMSIRVIARSTAGRRLDVTVGVVGDANGRSTAALAIDKAPPVTLTDEEMKHLAHGAFVAVHEAILWRRSR